MAALYIVVLAHRPKDILNLFRVSVRAQRALNRGDSVHLNTVVFRIPTLALRIAAAR